MDKKILVAIPARKGSKRIKWKNIYEFQGKPLVVHPMETALALNFPNKRIIVSTDSPEIGKLAVERGIEYIDRPTELAEDLSADIDWLRHALNYLKQKDGYEPDYILHIRATTPQRDPAIVEKLVTEFIENGEADALRTVQRVDVVIEKCVWIGPDGYMKDYFGNNLRDINLCTQNFHPPYKANGYVDVFKNMDFTGKIDIFHNLKVIPYLTDPVMDIDTYKDFEQKK